MREVAIKVSPLCWPHGEPSWPISPDQVTPSGRPATGSVGQIIVEGKRAPRGTPRFPSSDIGCRSPLIPAMIEKSPSIDPALPSIRNGQKSETFPIVTRGRFGHSALWSTLPDPGQERLGTVIEQILGDPTAKGLGIIPRSSERDGNAIAAVGVEDGGIDCQGRTLLQSLVPFDIPSPSSHGEIATSFECGQCGALGQDGGGVKRGRGVHAPTCQRS